MSLDCNATYSPVFPFTSGHVQTLWASLVRPRPWSACERERIETPDGDFLDIDWRRVGSCRVAVISHGLEGNSRKKYAVGAALALNEAGWDTVNLNFRGCSGEPNRLPRLYHSGVTDDLHTGLTHALASGGYAEAGLVGFSMGGNQTLKYLGECPDSVPKQVTRAVAFSVPCDLGGAAEIMARPSNAIYMEYFLRGLRRKVREKAARFPELEWDLEGLRRIRTFQEFDDRFTAPLHGFLGAADYYARCSSLQFLKSITVDTLLVNGLDDPFLSASCYPGEDAGLGRGMRVETPRHGGHVGFVPERRGEPYWSEKRLAAFFTE